MKLFALQQMLQESSRLALEAIYINDRAQAKVMPVCCPSFRRPAPLLTLLLSLPAYMLLVQGLHHLNVKGTNQNKEVLHLGSTISVTRGQKLV